MKNNPTISVVMPVFNGGKYLGEAIESILKQTYPNFEFLIINDGSTDESEEIIRSYSDPRIIYLQNDRNRGLVYTLNYGISQAKGEYIARMDADDISEPIRFERQLEVFSNDPEVGVCGTCAKIIDSGRVMRVETVYEKIKCKLLLGSQFIHPSIMFRKAKLPESGLLYKEKDFPAEDYALWIKLSESVKMVNIPEPLLNYRVHASQISSASLEPQKQRTNELRIQQITDFLNYEPSEHEKKVYLLFLNQDQIFPDFTSLNNIHGWIIKLKSLNSQQGYYNQTMLEECINEFLATRFLFQSDRNNNPLFLATFYTFYFQHEYKFNLKFHLKFILKCLICYNPKKKLWVKH